MPESLRNGLTHRNDCCILMHLNHIKCWNLHQSVERFNVKTNIQAIKKKKTYKSISYNVYGRCIKIQRSCCVLRCFYFYRWGHEWKRIRGGLTGLFLLPIAGVPAQDWIHWI